MKKIRNTVTAIAVAAAFIAPYEGLEKEPYLDAVGVPTVCYGTTQEVQFDRIYNSAECKQLLKRDVIKADNAVERLVRVSMPAPRKTALISFTYNLGEGNFARSTLLKKLNNGDVVGACNELPKWVYAGGVVLPGLVKRRNAERELCLEEGNLWSRLLDTAKSFYP